MKTTVEPLEGNKVKLSVELDDKEFDKAIDAAFRKLAREVRIPGFRPGKAPRKVLEARLGPEVGRGQALQDSLPTFYVDAVKEHEVDVIAAPKIEITAGEDEGPVAFEAVVEVRPIVQVPGYGSLRVTLDSPEPADEDVDAQLERLRNQFSELESVDREAADGDFVTIDVNGSQDGEPIEQLQAEDFLYEVGSGGIVPEIDEHLRGAGPDQTLEFGALFPGRRPTGVEDEVEDEAESKVESDSGENVDGDDEAPPELRFVVIVKEVKEKVLPDLDDSFANDASEFETLEELKEDLRDRLRRSKKAQAQIALREETGRVLAELVEDEAPDALIDTEVSQRLNDLSMRLQAQGLDLDSWVSMSGRQPDEIVAEMREGAAQAVKIDLALRSVADAEALECTDEDLEAEFAQLAERLNLKAKEVRKQFERADQVPAVRSDIKKRKAFDWLLERVEIVDADGKMIERASLAIDDEPDEETDQTSENDEVGATTEAEASTEQSEKREDDE